VARARSAGYLAQMDLQSQPLPIPIWRTLPGLSDYPGTVAAMEAHVGRMAEGVAREEIWLVEHPPILTAGTSAEPGDLLNATRFPVLQTGRGGRYTYHGPGQRVVYPMLDLGSRGRDVRRYVAALEQWGIRTLTDFGLSAYASDIGTGIWIDTGAGPAKIGAIGVRVRRWISFHGLSINVSTDLEHFGAIIPCGLSDKGVTRLADVVTGVQMSDLDAALRHHLPEMLHHLSAPAEGSIKTLEAR
jgi:lipoyl(octanoyl) transferase